MKQYIICENQLQELRNFMANGSYPNFTVNQINSVFLMLQGLQEIENADSLKKTEEKKKNGK